MTPPDGFLTACVEPDGPQPVECVGQFGGCPMTPPDGSTTAADAALPMRSAAAVAAGIRTFVICILCHLQREPLFWEPPTRRQLARFPSPYFHHNSIETQN